MRSLLIAAFVVSLAWALPARASNDPVAPPDLASQARRVADIQLPPPGITQRLTLTDGSVVYGRVESIDADAVQFRSIAGIVLTVPRDAVVDLRVVEGRVVAGEFQPADSHNTRLLFAPTGRALRKGEGYIGVYELFFPFVQVGITNRLSVGGGTPILFGGGDSDRPFWFTPKLQLLARERVQAAAGVIHIDGTGGDAAGIAYGVTTLGPAEKAATIGLGYANSGDTRSAIVMIGGEYRTSRRIKWITENWFWRGSANGVVSGGVRFLGERLSADLGLIVPLVDEPIAFPMVSFAWSF